MNAVYIRSPGTHLSAADVTVIREMAALGAAARLIARVIGCSGRTVTRHIPPELRAERTLTPRYQPSKLDDVLIWRMAAEGRSWREIGLIAGCNRDTARLRYARLTASAKPGALVPAGRSTLDIPALKALVRAGHAREDVARIVGCTEATVRRHCPGARSRKVIARGDRLLRAYESTPTGERGELAARFGYASLKSFYVCVHRLRQRRAAEAGARLLIAA